jgi:hypothetical protein
MVHNECGKKGYRKEVIMTKCKVLHLFCRNKENHGSIVIMCDILSFNSVGAKDSGLWVYYTKWQAYWSPVFRRNMLPSSSAFPDFLTLEDESCTFPCNVGNQ